MTIMKITDTKNHDYFAAFKEWLAKKNIDYCQLEKTPDFWHMLLEFEKTTAV